MFGGRVEKCSVCYGKLWLHYNILFKIINYEGLLKKKTTFAIEIISKSNLGEKD